MTLRDSVLQDARHGLRLVRRAPAFSAIVILTLGLGIGGTTAILGLVNTIYFATLPIPQPDRVLRLYDSAPGPSGDRRLFGMHSQNVVEVLRRTDLFAGAAAMFGEDVTIAGSGEPERITVVSRTDGWRDALGVVPALGRDFTADENRRGRESGVALVSEALWRRRSGGARVGSAVLRLDGRPFVVVGVMPVGFRFPYEADAWIPEVVNPANTGRDYAVFARMREGIDAAHVRPALDVTSAQLRRRYPDALPGYAIAFATLRQNLVSNEASATLALVLIVAFLLLLACANVATLLLARWSARRREFALRAALGASRARQVQQALTETMIFAVAGGLLGLLFAAWAAPVTARLIPGNIAVQLGLVAPRMDWRVLAGATVVSLITAVLSGFVPVLGSTTAPAAMLQEGGRSGADSPRTRRLLTLFAAAQVALALVLLAGASAVLQNLRALQRRDLGVVADGLLTMTLTPSRVTHASAADREQLARRIVQDVSSLSSVEAVGLTTVNPFGGATWDAQVIVEGHDTGRDNDAVGVNLRLVTPGLFRAMGTPLLQGRDFDWQDSAGRVLVSVMSSRMAARLWPGENAIGKRVRMARPNSQWVTVVGVSGDVADARELGDPDMTWYLPLAQYAASPAAQDFHLMVRARASVLPEVRTAIHRSDAALPIYDIATMEAYYARTLDRDRLGAALTGAFVVFGLLLAALGVHGVMAFAVARRAPELALRVALGATRRAIVTLVLGGTARTAAAGMLVGVLGAAAVRRVLASVLPNTTGVDLPSLAVTLAILSLVIAVAAYVPAVRASRVDPLDAMRT